jgi:hypothetical protein
MAVALHEALVEVMTEAWSGMSSVATPS